MSRNQKVAIIVALITGICTIISAVIGNYIGKENAVNEVINQATNTINVDIGNIDDLIVAYGKMSSEISALKDENLELIREKETLKNENDALTDDTEQISYLVEVNSSLLEENNLLKNQITELQNELKLANNGIGNQENETASNPEIIINNTGKKVSIFGLTTFRGYDHWYSRSDKSDSYFIDTYDIEYPNAHLGYHSPLDENDLDREPTYLLDKKYSTCTGHIAWSKECKNYSGSAWIDFYSGSTLIYSSPVITADSRLTEFSCDVSDVEKLTIMVNGTGLVYIIYPEFDLIEK